MSANYNPFDGLTITPNKDSGGFTISKTKKISVKSGDNKLSFEGSFTIANTISEKHDMSELLALVNQINAQINNICESTEGYVIDYNL